TIGKLRRGGESSNDRLQRCPAGQLVDPDGLAERVGLSAKELVVQAVDDPREALSRVQNRTGDRRGASRRQRGNPAVQLSDRTGASERLEIQVLDVALVG